MISFCVTYYIQHNSKRGATGRDETNVGSNAGRDGIDADATATWDKIGEATGMHSVIFVFFFLYPPLMCFSVLSFSSYLRTIQGGVDTEVIRMGRRGRRAGWRPK